MTHKVVIVGGGHAGGQVAATLRQFGFQGRLELIGAEVHLPYQRPPLSKQILCGEMPPERIRLKPVQFYAEREITLSLGSNVTAIRPDQHRLELADGSTRDYDQLVLATGSRLRTLALPGADLAAIHYLRDLDDSLALRDELSVGRRVVIIGAGYIGLEVAASATKLGCEVTVVEMADRILARVATGELSTFFQRFHESHGVTFHLGRTARAFCGDQRVQAVELDGGQRLDADVVVVGVGVEPQAELARDAGLAVGRAIEVGPHADTSAADIFAVGDVTEFDHPILERRLHLESVQNAVGQARVAAQAIAGDPSAYGEIPWFWSEQADLRLQIAGIVDEDDEQVLRGRIGTDGFSVFGMREGRVVSVQSVNRAGDYMAARKLIAAAARIPASAVADADVNLKDYLES